MNCNTLGILTSPPQTYYSFFPNARLNKRNNDSRQQSNNGSSVNDVVRQFAQLLVSGSGPVIPPHNKLSCRPCANYMQGNCNKPTSGPTKCAYDHKLFPRDYSPEDRLVLSKWVEEDPRLSWSSGAKQAMEKMKASGNF